LLGFLGKNNKDTATLQDRHVLRPIHGSGCFVSGKGTRVKLDKSFEHLRLIGPTGSGKNGYYLDPQLFKT